MEDHNTTDTTPLRLQQRYRAAWAVLDELPADVLLDGLVQPVLDAVDRQSEDVAKHYVVPARLARLHLLRRLSKALDRIMYEDAVNALSKERPADVARAIGVKTGQLDRWMMIRIRRYDTGNDDVE